MHVHSVGARPFYAGGMATFSREDKQYLAVAYYWDGGSPIQVYSVLYEWDDNGRRKIIESQE
jgi:hypothetical protein